MFQSITFKLFAILLFALLVLSATTWWQYRRANALSDTLTQTQQTLNQAQTQIQQIQQQQAQFAHALSQMQAQHSQAREQLHQALNQNPEWGKQRLPESIKRAIAK